MLVLVGVTVLLLTFYVLMIAFYYYGWHKAEPFAPKPTEWSPSTKVSIIVPVRNEEHTIGTTLSHILAQHYPKDLMEVIVVDDFSQDNTRAKVESIKDARCQMLALSHYYQEHKLAAPKKEAVSLAIGKAKGELIVTTDGDCWMGPHWLATIVGFYERYAPGFIAAPVLFKRSHSFLSTFQALDMVAMMGITCATIANGIPIICNGANLAFAKKTFDEVGGYRAISDTATGDDVFLMLKVNKHDPGSVRFLKARQAIVTTWPQSNWQGFYDQRKRWISKSSKFGDWQITGILVLSYLFNLAIIVNTLMGLFIGPIYLSIAAGSLLVKVILDAIFLWPVARYFHQKSLLWHFFPIQVVHVFYVVIMGAVGSFGAYRWKGRWLY